MLRVRPITSRVEAQCLLGSEPWVCARMCVRVCVTVPPSLLATALTGPQESHSPLRVLPSHGGRDAHVRPGSRTRSCALVCSASI